MEQVTGRIDGVLDPTLLLLNGTTWAFFTGLIVLMYKQPAGIIAGLVEAILAMANRLLSAGILLLIRQCHRLHCLLIDCRKLFHGKNKPPYLSNARLYCDR